MKLTPAAHRYIARLYEQGIDKGLDVHAIRQHLTDNGIERTPAQLVHDLDNVYSFYGYCASHQPAPVESAQQWDAK